MSRETKAEGIKRTTERKRKDAKVNSFVKNVQTLTVEELRNESAAQVARDAADAKFLEMKAEKGWSNDKKAQAKAEKKAILKANRKARKDAEAAVRAEKARVRAEKLVAQEKAKIEAAERAKASAAGKKKRK